MLWCVRQEETLNCIDINVALAIYVRYNNDSCDSEKRYNDSLNNMHELIHGILLNVALLY